MFGQANRLFPGSAFVLAAVVVLGVSTSASADSINIFGDTANSTEGLADFSGMLTYEFVLGDMGLLTVDLTNTTVFAIFGDDPPKKDDGGYLTGFVFNANSADAGITSVLASTTDPDFLDTRGDMAGPFGGPFLGGASLGGNFLDGGNPMEGLGIGMSGTFTFEIMASDAEFLSAADFGLNGPFEFNFIVRFRGLGKGGEFSDMVPVPAPGALALLGLGALAQRRRRRSA